MGKRKESDVSAGGRHRPRRFRGITEYSSTFKFHDAAAKRSGIRPVGNLMSNEGTVEGITVQRQDYVEHPIDKVQPFRRSGEIVAQDGEMDLRTSYDSEFTGKKGTPVKFVKPSDAILVKTPPKFNANPTYRADYQEWGLSKREIVKAPDEYVPSTEPMQNETTFRSEFQPKRASPRKSKKPDQEMIKSDQPMEGKTSNQLDFVTHPLPPRFKKEKENYRMSSSKVESMTTARRDYTSPKKAGKQKSCKPVEKPLHSGDPFDDATTAKSDFKKWEVKLPVLHQPEMYIKPSGELDTLTTSRRDFPPRKTERPGVAVKRQDHSLTEVGPFNDLTNYKQDFRKWDDHVPERSLDPSRKPYEKPSQSFGGATNYQADFEKKELSPRENFAPKPREKETGEFYGTTSYADEYISRKVSGKVQKTRILPDHYKARTVLPKIETMTTQKHDYTTKEFIKARSFKPAQEPLNTKEPFEDKTTCRQDYKEWTVELPKIHQADVYVKPVGEIDLQTTMKTDFPPRKLEKVVISKPPSNKLDGNVAPFDGATNYKNSFQPYEGHRAEKGTNPTRRPYQKPEERFAVTTSYGDSFDRKVASRRQAIKPKPMEKDTTEAFDGHTSYREAYLPRKAEKRSTINPLKYGNYIMDYIDSEDDLADVPRSSAVATEKPFQTPPASTQIPAVV